MRKARKPTVFVSPDQIFNEVISRCAQSETPKRLWLWSAEFEVTPNENDVLVAVGELLGSHCRRETAKRCSLGHGEKYAAVEERAQLIEPECGTSWAYNIAHIAGDIWEHALRSDKQDLRATLQEIEHIKAKGKIRIVENEIGAVSTNSDNSMPPYETTAARHEAMQRMQRLETKAETLDQMISSGRVSIGFGSYELTRGRHNLKEAGYDTVEDWQQDWNAIRWFLMAKGTHDVSGGNSCLRVLPSERTEGEGVVEVALPKTLAHFDNRSGDGWFRLSAPVRWPQQGAWLEHVQHDEAINYSLKYSRRVSNSWFLSASWRSGTSAAC